MKEAKKVIRTILQFALLFGFIGFTILSSLKEPQYEAAVYEATGEDHPFIALSYTSIDDMDTERVMDADLFDQHMAALHKAGYVTITQKDIHEYYAGTKVLPEKSLFLMFEDGRRDTALYAQPVLEKYNFKATMFTYAKQMDSLDPRFLNRAAVKELDNNSYWDVATNGYRFEYINTYDRHNHYVGRLTSQQFNEVREYLGEYNHYLMDYIRDEDNIPLESHANLVDRIDTDYQKLTKVYEETLGYVPGTYAIMHANSKRYGVNDKVSDANEANIKKMFQLTFNQTGYALNNKHNSNNQHNLSRYNVAYNCSVNHLLKEIEYETGNTDLPWVNKKIDGLVTVSQGLATANYGEVVLTSDIDQMIHATLGQNLANFEFETTLSGSQSGSQQLKLGNDLHHITIDLEQTGIKVSQVIDEEPNLLKQYTYGDIADVDQESVAQAKEKAVKIIEAKTKEYINDITISSNEYHADYIPKAKSYVEYNVPVKIKNKNGQCTISLGTQVMSVELEPEMKIDLTITGQQADLVVGENWKDSVYDLHLLKPKLTSRNKTLINLKDSIHQKEIGAKKGLKRLFTHLDLI